MTPKPPFLTLILCIGISLLLASSSCSFSSESYQFAESPASFEELFVASHDILSLYYLFEFIDKEKGILETHWIVTPKVESFGSERHRIRLRIQRAPQGSFLYLRVDLEERSNDPSLPGVPPWLPLGQDSEKEDALLQTLLNSANSTL